MFVVVVIAAAAAALVNPRPAAAWPSDCEIFNSEHSANYKCWQGTGHYQVIAYCDKFFGLFTKTVVGNFAAITYWSSAACPSGYELYDYSVATTNS
jgi:hypothetical protein